MLTFLCDIKMNVTKYFTVIKTSSIRHLSFMPACESTRHEKKFLHQITVGLADKPLSSGCQRLGLVHAYFVFAVDDGDYAIARSQSPPSD